MIKIKLALDWTPNTNHIGFFVASELGLYEKQGISLEVINPIDNNYQMTPGKQLELDFADFAIAPFETVISLNNKENKVHAVAVFAILQEDLSSIATLKISNIDSPKFLDNKTYASYKARYEDHIVKQMVMNSGGEGNINVVYPNKLGIWNTLLEGKATSTWIFDNWEGVEAEIKNVPLNKFKMADYGIPYGYSPVLLTKSENIIHKKEVFTRFIKATKQGFLLAKENPSRAITILKKYLPNYDLENIDLQKSFEMTAEHFGDELSCGIMKPERVTSFLKWLVENKLEDKVIIKQHLFTNDLIK